MKVCVLASGSKGNITYVETEKTRSLIDVGMSCAYIENALNEIGVDPKSIENIFLTHTHSDHTNGLRVFLKKNRPTIYLTEKMDDELGMLIDEFYYIEDEITIKDLTIKPIKTSHDVADSNGYIFTSNDKSLMYMTDTGYINVRNHGLLKGHNMYVLESNHDIVTLMNGSYPYHLKQRIQSDSGHLSNKQCADYLTKFVNEKTKTIILAHLSEQNNDPDIALKTIYETFEKANKKIPKVIVAKQKERTELIEL